jgi:hypothetical protein
LTPRRARAILVIPPRAPDVAPRGPGEAGRHPTPNRKEEPMAAIRWSTDLKAATEEAKRTQKPLFIDIYKIPG